MSKETKNQKPKTKNQRRFDGSTLTATRVRETAIVFPPVRCGPGARTARSVRGRRRDLGARRFGAPLAPASAARAGAGARAERSTGGGGDRRAGAGRDRSAGRARARARAAPPAWIFPREKEKRAEALSEALRAIGGVGAGDAWVLPRRATSGLAYLLIAQERARSTPSLARALAPRRSSARGDAPRASSLDARARLPPATDRAGSRRRPPRPRGRGRRGGDAEASRRHRARRPPARVDEARREPATRGCGAEAGGGGGGGQETSDARARAKQKKRGGREAGRDRRAHCV